MAKRGHSSPENGASMAKKAITDQTEPNTNFMEIIEIEQSQQVQKKQTIQFFCHTSFENKTELQNLCTIKILETKKLKNGTLAKIEKKKISGKSSKVNSGRHKKNLT